MSPDEEEAINRAKQQGYGEDVYIPMLASKKMREKDAQLASQYESYRKSPSTFMSGLKSEYGKEGRGAVWDALGFAWNMLADVGENVEEMGSLIANPLDTAKGLYDVAASVTPLGNIPWTKRFEKSKMIREGIMQQIKENFGSVERARETFYENPFDVLSTFIPLVGQAGKVTKLGKITQAAKIAEWASQASKATSTISKMRNLVDFDLAVLNKVRQWASWAKNLATQWYSQLAFGSKWAPVLGKMISATEDPARIAKQAEFAGMTNEALAEIPWNLQSQIRKEAGSEISKTIGELSSQPVRSATTQTWFKMADDTPIFEWKSFSAGKWDNLVDIIDEVWETTPDTVQASQTINDAFKMSGLKKENWLNELSIKEAEKFKWELENALSSGKLSQPAANVVTRFTKWFKDIEEKAYPEIANVKNKFKEAADFTDDMVKEIGSSKTKNSTIANNLAKVISESGLSKETIDFIASKTGTNLEDVAIALKGKDIMWRAGSSNIFGTMIGWGLAGSIASGNWVVPAAMIGYATLTSPYILYKVAKLTWPKRAFVINKLTKATWATKEAVEWALKNIGMAKDAWDFEKIIKQATKPSNLGFLERILDSAENVDKSVAVQEEREQLGKDIQEMESSIPQKPTQTTQEQGQNVSWISDEELIKAGYNPATFRSQ